MPKHQFIYNLSEFEKPVVIDYAKVLIEYKKWLKLKQEFEAKVKNKKFLPKDRDLKNSIEIYSEQEYIFIEDPNQLFCPNGFVKSN